MKPRLAQVRVAQTCPLGCWVATGIGPAQPNGTTVPLHYPTKAAAVSAASAAIRAGWRRAA